MRLDETTKKFVSNETSEDGLKHLSFERQIGEIDPEDDYIMIDNGNLGKLKHEFSIVEGTEEFPRLEVKIIEPNSGVELRKGYLCPYRHYCFAVMSGINDSGSEYADGPVVGLARILFSEFPHIDANYNGWVSNYGDETTSVMMLMLLAQQTLIKFGVEEDILGSWGTSVNAATFRKYIDLVIECIGRHTGNDVTRFLNKMMRDDKKVRYVRQEDCRGYKAK